MSQSHSLFEAYQAVYTPQEQDDYQLVLDYLVSEGYVDDVDEAELVIEQLEDDVIDGILDEVKGCGGKVNPDNGDYENGSGSARMMMSPRKKALAMARRRENEATTPQHQRQAAKMRRVASNMKEETMNDIPEGFKPTNYTYYRGPSRKGKQLEKQIQRHRDRGDLVKATQMDFINRMMDDPEGRKESMEKSRRNRLRPDARARRDAQQDSKKYGMKEELDTYDLVLEYLLSEGFADNEEAALQIMSNMSEEWMEEAVSHYVNS
jgi:hypothetical protein